MDTQRTYTYKQYTLTEPNMDTIMDDKFITICCAYLDLKASMEALKGKDDDLVARIERTLDDLDDSFSEYDLPCLRVAYTMPA